MLTYSLSGPCGFGPYPAAHCAQVMIGCPSSLVTGWRVAFMSVVGAQYPFSGSASHVQLLGFANSLKMR